MDLFITISAISVAVGIIVYLALRRGKKKSTHSGGGGHGSNGSNAQQ